jgi:hypothetical protein
LEVWDLTSKLKTSMFPLTQLVLLQHLLSFEMKREQGPENPLFVDRKTGLLPLLEIRLSVCQIVFMLLG